ncbi:2-hydroxyacid dehydrogenase [Limnohabitans planktonicus]|uniref:Phosphoglycerate dehydrogenase n=1 Tax=Limnohabitans planktonicus II-D5 TaxID=1293045 RepID=A0A2T7UID2_9BURK|nr:2-hydroxyacid dehydrogenase [Limnohabitans planktonicus]PVE44453.1 phosphoglycerate dehydrogenase [Limnohabitans planktonicus II-D5]|eukprot:gene3109-3038_t
MSIPSLKIVFHGQNAANFRHDFETLIDPAHQLLDLSDALDQAGEREHYESADVVIGIQLNDSMPRPLKARLFHAPAAGTDAVNIAFLPPACTLANCFGHENAIAEYVIAALLMRHVPLARADQDLREQRWTYWAGRPSALRTELGTQTLGLLGFGHIAQTLAQRAKAMGMQVLVANRSPISHPVVDRSWTLDALQDFMGSCDAVVVCLPLTDNTQGLVDAPAIAAMRPDAMLLNVGRGAVIDEKALYQALKNHQIGGAVIDTWYQYPTPTQPECAPSQFDFASLDNVLMTPHMSGWTTGTVRRRQETLADNIRRLSQGEALINVVRGPLT